MKKIFGKGSLSIILLCGISSFSHADIIVNQLYNTGLDNIGAATPATGGIDSHWMVDGQSAVSYKHPAYAANDFDSLWVSVNQHGGNETTSATTYTYSTTFDLTGYDSSSASISGLWGADNYGTIFLNGHDTGNTLDFGYAAFTSLNQFSIADYFNNGINTLSVELTNGHLNPAYDPGPGALRFDNLELSAIAVPEPGTIALLSLGLAGLFCARRK
jgi:hypothetical protein